MRRRYLAGVVAILATGMCALALVAGGGGAGAQPFSLLIAPHGRLDNGRPLPHLAGATEVSFADERAEAADASAASDAPPDATVSALGCANRGSATNPRVNQDCTLRRQAEEQIVVNPTDPTNVIAGQNDSRVGFNKCGFDYSLDGGSTWGDGQPGFFQHLSPLGHTYDAASDPAVTFDGTGRAWFSCVVFDLNTPASGLFAVPSTPGLKGAAYANIGAGPSPYVVAEVADNHVFYDKEFIAADPRPGHQEVYVTFTKFVSDQKCGRANNPGAYCSSEIFYSKWNGSAWSTPTNVSGSSPTLCYLGDLFDRRADPHACNFDQGSYPVVDPSTGNVTVVWNNGNTAPGVPNGQTLARRINTDGSMGPVVKVGDDVITGDALCDLGRGPEECVGSLGVRTNDYPAVAVDPSNTSHLVAVWQDTRLVPSGSAGLYDVVVSDSTDGGATWTETNVLAGATGETYSQPAVAVTRTGATAVSFYRTNPYSGTDFMGTYGYGMRTRPAGGAFGGFVPLSDSQALPSPQANASQRGFLGDYSSITASTAAGSSEVLSVWADTRNTNSAGPDEDIFVRRVAL